MMKMSPAPISQEVCNSLPGPYIFKVIPNSVVLGAYREWSGEMVRQSAEAGPM
jgi:hypothetical protein